MTIASFTMPTPPSTNALFSNRKGIGRVKTAKYKDFIMMGVASIRNQKIKPVKGNVLMLIGVERRSERADIDNRLKALLDAIVTAGTIEDDCFITALAVSWLPKANGLSHVSILPVSQTTLTFHPSQNGASGGWFINAPQPENKEQENGHKPI